MRIMYSCIRIYSHIKRKYIYRPTQKHKLPLVETTPIDRRVVGTNPALVAT